MLDQPPVGCGGAMVELIHDDVIELLGVEPAQMFRPPQGLDRREQDVSFVLGLSGVEAEPRFGPDAPERSHRLSEDFVAIGDEEHALARERIERRQPGLAKARGKDDQSGPFAFCPRSF